MQKLIPISLFIVLLFGSSNFALSQVDESDYQIIPRSRFEVIPPKDYSIHSINAAIIKDDMNYMMFSAFVGTNYFTELDSMKRSDPSFLPGPTKIMGDTVVGDYQGFYMQEFDPPSQLATILLYFGDSSFAVAVIGIYNYSDEWEENELLHCAFSVKYDPNKEIDPLDKCLFSFDNKASSFMFSDLNGMSQYGFTPKGVKFDLNGTKVMVNVTTYESGFSLSEMAAQRLVNNKMDGMSDYAFNGDESYTKKGIEYFIVDGYFTQFDRRFYFYMQLMTDGEAIIGCIGSAPKEELEMYEEIKAFIGSIKFSDYWIALRAMKN